MKNLKVKKKKNNFIIYDKYKLLYCIYEIIHIYEIKKTLNIYNKTQNLLLNFVQ